MTESEGSPLESETIAQPEALQHASREQSIPKGVTQHPEAPKIPGYILTRPLGKGAFAQVWRAWQIRTRKNLAVKVFHQARGVNWLYLQREVERLIRLDKHPNIVSLFDADLNADPPYYAMDLMEGGSLERYVGGHERPPPGAVQRWAEEIADALAFVHAKGLLHCDLKPANVMLDDQGRARVADFGQSRILTDSAGALGTLFYMAPEQAVLNADGVELHPDVRWDIFALGTTLYAVMAGRLPFVEQRAKLEAAKSLKDRLAAYREVVAAHPLSFEGPATPAEEDLRAIIGKCAAPAPEARYQGVAQVSADLSAMRALMPVSPLAASRSYRVRRFVQRNLALVALGAAAFIGLVFTGVKLVRAQSDAQRRLAFSYAMRGRQFSEQGNDASAAAYYSEAYRLDPKGRLARAAALLHLEQLAVPTRVYPHRWGVRAFALSPDGKYLLTGSLDKGAALRDTSARDSDRKTLADEASVTALDFDSPGARAITADKNGIVRVWRLPSGDLAKEWQAHSGEISIARFSPDGSKILTVGADRAVRLWTADAGARLGPEPLQAGEVTAASFSPDGSRLAVAVNEDNSSGVLRIWDVAAAQLQDTLRPMHEDLLRVLFSPDGRSVACLGSSGGVWTVDLGVRPPVSRAFPVTSATSIAFSPKSSRLAIGFADGSAQIWDALAGFPAGLLTPPGPAVREVRLLSDDRALMTGDDEGVVRLWDAVAGVPVGPLLRNSGSLFQLSVSRDERVVASAANDGTVMVWAFPLLASSEYALAVGEASRDEFSIHNLELRGIFGKEDLSAILSDPMGAVFVLHGGVLMGAGGRPVPGVEGKVRRDQRSVALSTPDKDVQILELAMEGSAVLAGAAGREKIPTGMKTLRVGKSAGAMAFSRDASKLFTAGGGGAIRVWDVATGAQDGAIGEGAPRQAFFSLYGPLVLTADSAGVLQVRDLSGSAPPAVLGEKMDILAAAFSSDGRYLATGDEDGAVKLWDIGKPLEPIGALPVNAPVNALAFSPEGALFAAGAADGTILLGRIEEPGARKLAELSGQQDAVSALSFSPDGKRLLAGSWDNTARIWDVARCVAGAESMARAGGKRQKRQSKQELEAQKALQDAGEAAHGPAVATCDPAGASFRHAADVAAVAFDPTGRRVASADWEGVAVVWDAATGQSVGAALRHPKGISSIAFSRDGAVLLTGGLDGTARLWDSETGEPIWRSVAVGALVTKVAFSPDGSHAIAAGADGAVRMWRAPQALAAKAPSLYLKALVAGQRRVNGKGDIETVPPDELPALMERLTSMEAR